MSHSGQSNSSHTVFAHKNLLHCRCVCGGPHDLDYWELCSAIGQEGERYEGVVEKDVIEGRGEGEGDAFLMEP